MLKFDLLKYTTHAAIGYGAFLAYDTLVLGYKLDGGFAYSDAGSFAMSSVIAYFSYEILSSVVPYLNENNLLGMISYPLLTGIVYMYLFDYMVRPSFSSNRDNVNLVLMGAVSCLVLNYASNPIMSLFGVNTY